MRGVIRGHGPATSWWLDGKQVTKHEFDRVFPDVRPAPGAHTCAPELSSLCGWKPLASDALAVHPAQVGEARVNAEAKGVPTDFLPDGRPVFRSRGHRAEYLKAYGFFDRDAGYGDPADGPPGRGR